MSGTSGQSKRLEAIQIQLKNNSSYKGAIQYQTHIENIGWQGWKTDGEMSGTSGQSKR
ncbi:serine protease, partial [Coprobacillus sp. AF31-1BH]